MTACALSFNIAPPASVEVARPVLACDRAPPEAPMLKSELIERVTAENPHLYQRDVEKIINAILDTITTAQAQGDRIELRGFGVFAVKTREARTGRNPRNGSKAQVSEKVFPTFKTSRDMHRRLNFAED